jgi:hypothetical protein
MYPLYSYGACEALFTDMVKIKAIGNSEVEKKYYSIIDQYIEKSYKNYRPESFFNKITAETKKAELEFTGPKLQQTQDHVRLFLSDFYHYDNSIKLELMDLAEHKYTPSFYCLGFVHERGIGTKVNHVEAWAWFMTAFAVDGIYAKEHLTRVWKYLSTQDEMKAKLLADKYIQQYTEVANTPSVTILQ